MATEEVAEDSIWVKAFFGDGAEMESKVFDDVFLETFKKRTGLYDLGPEFSFNELVILSVLPTKFFGTNADAASPAEIQESVRLMFHPFPPPMRPPTIYELLRVDLAKKGFIDTIIDKSGKKSEEAKGRKKYAASDRGRIQLFLTMSQIAKHPRSADEAIFLIHSALLWADVRRNAQRLKKVVPDSVLKLIGWSDKDLTTILLGVNPKETQTMQTEVVARLREVGEATAADSVEDKKVFEKAAMKTLYAHQATTEFFRDGLATFRDFFAEKAKKGSATNDLLPKFAPMKDRLFADMCSEAIKLVET
jgi:DNA-binding PadR family transcriptional regulator